MQKMTTGEVVEWFGQFHLSADNLATFINTYNSTIIFFQKHKTVWSILASEQGSTITNALATYK